MSANVVDYFCMLGPTPGGFRPKPLEGDDDEETLPAQAWQDAITDIHIFFPDSEELVSTPHGQEDGSGTGEAASPSSWEYISSRGECAEGEADDEGGGGRGGFGHPQLGFLRRRASDKPSHLTDIVLLQKNDVIPRGYEVIRMSVTGRNVADLNVMSTNSSTYLAFRRCVNDVENFIRGRPFIDDIIFLNFSQGDELPCGYTLVDRNINKGAPNGTDEVFLAYRRRAPVGICDMAYEAATLDRYPRQDHSGEGSMQLPETELPLFAFPNGMRLKYRPMEDYPLPDFFSFVFTNANGGHLYAACLRFYEIADRADVEKLFDETFSSVDGTKHFELQYGGNMQIFIPKMICVVSQHPFYRAMRRYLRQLYSLSLSSITYPLEYFVAAVTAQVPVPVPGGRPFYVELDGGLIAAGSRSMPPIQFEMPSPFFFPHMDLDFSAPLRCLSVDNMLALFALMLREAQIVFTCSSDTLLTEVMETMRSLLFPLKWSSTFISRLPNSLKGVIQAPGGFMVGMHKIDDDSLAAPSVAADGGMDGVQGMRSSPRVVRNNRDTDPDAEWRLQIWLDGLPLQLGTYVVDLTADSIYEFKGESAELLKKNQVEALTSSMPSNARRRLHKKLSLIARSYELGPQKTPLDQFDSAFEFHLPEASGKVDWGRFPTLVIRDSFMVFMVDLLGSYTKYMIPPCQDLDADTYRTFKEEFDVREYLGHAQRGSRAILERLMETQMFAELLQRRAEGSSYALAFFEAGSCTLLEMGLSTGGHDKHMGEWVASKGLEMPAPLFQLVEFRSNASLVQHQNAALFEAYRTNSQQIHARHKVQGSGQGEGAIDLLGRALTSIDVASAARPLSPLTTPTKTAAVAGGGSSSGITAWYPARVRATPSKLLRAAPAAHAIPMPLAEDDEVEKEKEKKEGTETYSMTAVPFSGGGAGGLGAYTVSDSDSGDSESASESEEYDADEQELEQEHQEEVHEHGAEGVVAEGDHDGEEEEEEEGESHHEATSEPDVNEAAAKPAAEPGTAADPDAEPESESKEEEQSGGSEESEQVEVETEEEQGGEEKEERVRESEVEYGEEEQQEEDMRESEVAAVTNVARAEISQVSELRLHDPSFGPLILPGPIKPADVHEAELMAVVAAADEERRVVAVAVAQAAAAAAAAEAAAAVEAGDEAGAAAIAAAAKDARALSAQGGRKCYSKQRRQSGLSFEYQDQWPRMHNDLFALATHSVHSRVKQVHSARSYSIESVGDAVRLLTRNEAERGSFRYSQRWIAHVVAAPSAAAEVDAPLSMSRRGSMHDRNARLNQALPKSALSGGADSDEALLEGKVACGLALDSLTTSIVLMCLRTRGPDEPRPVGTMLQVMGLLAQAEQLGLLGLLDETVWRGAFMSCAACGGAFMRAAACVLWETMRMLGVPLDALTYGQYAIALGATRCRAMGDEKKGNAAAVAAAAAAADEREREGNALMDGYLHLEEMGLVWFVHRSVLIHREALAKTQEVSAAAAKTSIFGGLFGRGKAAAAAKAAALSTTRLNAVRPAMLSTRRVALQVGLRLGLVRAGGRLTLLVPNADVLPLSPVRTVPSTATSSTGTATTAAAAAVASVWRRNNPSVRKFLSSFQNVPREVYMRYADEEEKTEAPAVWTPFRYSAEAVCSPFPSSAEAAITEVSAAEDGEGDGGDGTSTASYSPLNASMGVKDAKRQIRAVCDAFRDDTLARARVVTLHSQTPCVQASCPYLMLDEELMAIWSGFPMGQSGMPYVCKHGAGMGTAHTVCCPACGAPMSCRLTVRCVALSAPPESGEGTVAVAWTEDVAHLSPFGLRYALEQEMRSSGLRVTDPAWLHGKHPELYWNLMWYCARMGVPSGLAALPPAAAAAARGCATQPHPWDGAVLVAWSPRDANARARASLRGEVYTGSVPPPGSLAGPAGVVQVEDHLAIVSATLDRVGGDEPGDDDAVKGALYALLDGSKRDAMVGVLEAAQGRGGSTGSEPTSARMRARAAYQTTMWLNNARETERGRWAPDEHTDALRSSFDVEMQETVRSGHVGLVEGALSPADVKGWGVSVEDLRASVSPMAAQVIRHTLGVWT